LKRPGQSEENAQQQTPGPVQPFCGPLDAAAPHPVWLQTNALVQVVVMAQPVVLPVSNPPLVTRLPAHVGLQTIGVGDWVNVGQVVNVTVGDHVRVRLMVQVRVIVFELHGVHVRESVGGQVIVGVGVSGTAQQTFSST
jgi:hypothetical protein